MNNLVITECSGYNREEAFKDLQFNAITPKGANSTQSWRNAGSPIIGSRAFINWAISELSAKTGNMPGLGLYIVIDNYNPDTRTNPCKIINNKTINASDWTINYWVREDESILNSDGTVMIQKAGQILEMFDNKHDALKFAQNKTNETHKNYTLLRVKVPNNNFEAGYTIYSPSINANKGTFIAFGVNKI